MKATRLICSLICLVLGAQLFIPSHAVLAASPNGCVANWYVSYDGTSSFTLLRSDPLDLPLSALRFERSYNDPTDVSHGYLDFNSDGKSDVFAAVLRPDGNYQWMYSASGTSDWIDLAYAAVPPDDLRFSDFNGDGYTYVFAALPIGNGLLQWAYSSKGTNSFTNLAYADTPLSDLRFGDFNGDGKTDVFVLQDAGGGLFDWMVSYGGISSFTQINSATTPLSQMLFADVNRDGHTDVFTTVPDATEAGAYDWLYSSAGSAAYQTEVTTNLSYLDVHPGEFNDDYRSDFFFTTPLSGGLYQWWYQYHTVSPVVFGSAKLAYASIPPDQLRFGDFNGDHKTDVFALAQQCNVYLPSLYR
jgi:hypothetical protein